MAALVVQVTCWSAGGRVHVQVHVLLKAVSGILARIKQSRSAEKARTADGWSMRWRCEETARRPEIFPNAELARAIADKLLPPKERSRW